VSSVTICDVCGKELIKPYYKLRLLKSEPNQESRDMKTMGNKDMHEACFKLLNDWMTENRRKEQAK
jgi:hypothetical protein